MATRGRQLGRSTIRAGRRARKARPALPAHASRGRPKLNSHESSSRKSGWTKTLKLYTKTGLRTEPRMSCLGAVTLSPRGLSLPLCHAGQREKAAPYKPGAELWPRAVPRGTAPWDQQAPDCEEMNSCCLRPRLRDSVTAAEPSKAHGV